jgi:alkylation response protein AidB-like acyl-CoA dehydrogenase
MMDFSLSPEHTQLRARVRALVDDVLQPIEDEAERNHGRLSAETHARIHQAVLDSGLGANNIPKEFGGGGFNLTEQIVTHEQLGRLTNCLWVLVWSPSNVLVHGTPDQIERYLLPDVRGEHRHAYAITEGDAGSDPRAIEAEAVWNGEHYELSGVKWFVTDGDIACTSSSSRGPSTATSACPPSSSSTRTRWRRDDRRSRLHPQLPVPAPRVHVHEDARPAREHPW